MASLGPSSYYKFAKVWPGIIFSVRWRRLEHINRDLAEERRRHFLGSDLILVSTQYHFPRIAASSTAASYQAINVNYALFPLAFSFAAVPSYN